MQIDSRPAPVSKILFWTGWVMSVLPSLLLLFGGVMNVVKPAFVVEGSAKMGFPEDIILPLGIFLIASTVLYLVPRTAVLGAILLTGYLGGAVAVHVRQADGLFFVPILFAAVLWVGLLLRDAGLRALLPLKR